MGVSFGQVGNDAALMDTVRRATALRNAAAGQVPDETRHAEFVRRPAMLSRWLCSSAAVSAVYF